MLQSVEDVNHAQKEVLVEKVKKRFGDDLNGHTFAVWGLAFKPDTDDMRESPAVNIIQSLTSSGAKVKAYDPKAVNEAKEHYLKGNDRVEYCESKYEALKDADALLLITEWKEFRSPDFYEIKRLLKEAVIFDGRNQYDSKRVAEYGIEYYQIGVRGDQATAASSEPTAGVSAEEQAAVRETEDAAAQEPQEAAVQETQENAEVKA